MMITFKQERLEDRYPNHTPFRPSSRLHPHPNLRVQIEKIFIFANLPMLDNGPHCAFRTSGGGGNSINPAGRTRPLESHRFPHEYTLSNTLPYSLFVSMILPGDCLK
jgi:hypothetical protein